MLHREKIEEICERCPSEYCTLKEVVSQCGLNDRSLIQIKCLEKFKYEQSNYQKKDVEWDGAFQDWMNQGYAERFAQFYEEGKHWETIYREVMNGTREKQENQLENKAV